MLEIALLIAILLLIGAGIAFMLKEMRSRAPQPDASSFLMLQQQMNDLSRTLDTKLGESTRVAQEQFGQSARLIQEITRELTRVGEGQKQVMGVTEQLKNLQDILKNPKQRGILGEYYLETVLENVLPPGTYQMQYAFKNGEIVDAVIFAKERIIPIDSKFSLENYNRILETNDAAERTRLEEAFRGDLKNRIDETAKYVRPSENTTDFAFMFIPSEAIYYDLLVNKIGAVKSNTRDMIEYAMKDKKVVIVSPTSFLAYLQTVLQGLRALQIEESAKEILKRVEELRRHLGNYEHFVQKLGSHLGTTVNAYNTASKELGKIDKDILKITGESSGVDTMQLERPHADEESGG